MKLLFTALHPPSSEGAFGGVATWIATLSAVLEGVGHETAYWGPEMGPPEGEFDVCILSNPKYTGEARLNASKSFQVCHGIVDDEAPQSGMPVIFVSEEARNKWRLSGPVLRQPIDQDYWTPTRVKRECLTLYSYRAPDDCSLSAVAEILNLEFVHLKDVTRAQARRGLRRSALACASGRAALEAISCGAPTLIYDHRSPYQGRLMETSLWLSAKRNYSGRGGAHPAFNDLIQECSKTIEGGSQRGLILQKHKASEIAAQLLEIVNDL